ncbi:type VI secretion system ImpA family N-terminal domain-containing protein [Burkholderia plantarii]|uniref:type VI secretion system protein TssA n=1 Tax=Burkholderia plantarii TaxID=41899 RepID=UPI00272C3E8B|nr:type VI secretion system ImpA family N-terminal domain-containing protein [Burkholderia plantarii]WLE58806.1 type VI secretion system ImpA family N-terminal domain-containing protein [Burkholderia plantarii]
MSKKQSPRQSATRKGAEQDTPYHDWLAPVSDSMPCGPDLEYDHDFVVLFASAAPRQDVQYGAFVGTPDPVNWSELERDCRRLMARTKDIRVAVLYTRCRTRLAGAAGLAEGTGLLAAWLDAFAEHVHPQPDVEGGRDVAREMRMNAIQALADPEGLLADVREIVLSKSSLARLQVRDVERAFAHPRPIDALAPESVAQQLLDVREQRPEVMAGFDKVIAHLAAIDAWCAMHLEASLPDLTSLTRLLGRLTASASVNAAEPLEESSDPALASDEASESDTSVQREPLNDGTTSATERITAQPRSEPTDRQAALALIRSARTWFEIHEPSSPIPVLLKRAERFVGKPYAEVVTAIPAELLAQWEENGRGG